MSNKLSKVIIDFLRRGKLRSVVFVIFHDSEDHS
nr:MAG TPA: HORMA domain [Caudoviricetes sp.]